VFVPQETLAAEGIWFRAKAGDTLESIARGFGRPHGALELVGANLHRQLSSSLGGARAFPVRDEDRLRVPAAWLESSTLGKPIKINPNQMDAIGLAVAKIAADVAAGQTKLDDGNWASPLPDSSIAALANFASQFWRAKADTVPSKADVLPYLTSARRWWALWGKDMAPEQASSIPWAGIAFPGVQKFLLPLRERSDGPLPWALVKLWCDQNVKPGAWTPKELGEPGFAVEPKAWQDANEGAMHWKTTDWRGIPWACIPFSLMNVDNLIGTTTTERAQSLVDEIARVLGVPKAPLPKDAGSIKIKGPPVHGITLYNPKATITERWHGVADLKEPPSLPPGKPPADLGPPPKIEGPPGEEKPADKASEGWTTNEKIAAAAGATLLVAGAIGAVVMATGKKGSK